MFLLFLLRRLNPTARIITGAALVVAGVAAVLFVSFGLAFAVVGVVFVVSGLRAKRRERANQPAVESRSFAQISE
jgi:energy-coupling factor transporter transmembrane protein EcfT